MTGILAEQAEEVMAAYTDVVRVCGAAISG